MESGKQHIFLLRHGKPDFPDKRSYIYGHTDYPLAKLGVKQAQRAGRALSKIAMGRIISSDLSRAAETADIVAALRAEGICEVERDAALREIDMGEWDGVAKEVIRENFGDLFAARADDFANTSAPGGESFAQLQARGIGAFYRILEESRGAQNILLVAHGGIFWTIVSGLFNLPLGDIFRFGLDYCALHLLEYRRKSTPPTGGDFRLIRYNWSPSLMNYMDDMI